MQGLFQDEASSLPPIITKAAFADMVGVSKARVSQLISKGLPLTAAGKVPRDEALAWYRENISPHRRKADRHSIEDDPRRALERTRAELAELELAKARGQLVDRDAARRAVFERARAERDAHLAFVARAAPELAAESDADPAALFAALDRMMREHLAQLAETPFDALDTDPGH
ncbi:MAG: hypothetical protein AAFU70_08000 [Planctomycetota bacterium]